MATSRTGTTRYLRNRRAVLDQARRDGLTHCPGWTDRTGSHHPCGRELDWESSGQDDSVEADHIVAPKYGGTDDKANLTPLCRKCNNAKSDGTRTPTGFAPASDFPTSREW